MLATRLKSLQNLIWKITVFFLLELIPLSISACEILNSQRIILNKIIHKLDPNKANGHDLISICMLKMVDDAMAESLLTIFKKCLKCGIFFQMTRKKETLNLYLKKVTNEISKSINHSRSFQFAARFLTHIIYNNRV